MSTLRWIELRRQRFYTCMLPALVIASFVITVHQCLAEQSQAIIDAQRMYRVLSLEYEIQQYVDAKNYTELMKSLEEPQWQQAIETALSFGQNYTAGINPPYEYFEGTIRYKPTEADDPARPVWQDGDTLHLQILLNVIGYDAKKLGLSVTTIGPKPTGTRAILNGLITKIVTEKDRLLPVLKQDALAVTQTKVAADVFAQYQSLYDACQKATAEVQRQNDIAQACFSRCLADPNTERAIGCEKVCQVPFDAAVAASNKANDAYYAFEKTYACNSDFCIIDGHTTFKNP